MDKTLISFRDTECRDVEIVFDIDQRGVSVLRFSDALKQDYAVLIQALPGNENLTVHFCNQYNSIEEIDTLIEYYCDRYGVTFDNDNPHYLFLKKFLFDRQSA